MYLENFRKEIQSRISAGDPDPGEMDFGLSDPRMDNVREELLKNL